MAHDPAAHGARQHQHRSAAGEVPRAQCTGERLAVPARELALQPDLHLLRQPRRSLLSCLEQAGRTALDYHVPRSARVGTRVLINESWYNWAPSSTLGSSVAIP